MEGKHLKVGTIVRFPFVRENEDGLIYGSLPEFIIQCSKVLNFTFEWIHEPGGVYGKQLNDTHWSGVVGMCANGEVDVGAAVLTVTAARSETVTFLPAFHFEPIVILLNRHNAFRRPPGGVGFDLHKPFDTVTWSLLLFSYFIVFPLILISSQTSGISYSKRWKDLRFLNCLTILFATTVHVGAPIRIRSNQLALKMVTSAWWLSSFILSNLYNALIVSFLILAAPPDYIKSLSDLVESDLSWTYQTGTALDTLFNDPLSSEMYSKVGKGASTLVDTIEEGAERVKNGHSAFIKEESACDGQIYMDCIKNGRRDLMKTEEGFFMSAFAIAMPKESPYEKHFAQMMLKTQDTGLWVYWKRKYDFQWFRCDKFGEVKEEDHSMSMTTLLDLLWIAIFGTVGGLVIIVVEKNTTH